MRLIIILFVLFPLLSFSQVNQTDANGLKQGLWQKKQDNGQLIYEGRFKNDKPVGEWKRYHPGGQLKALIVYTGDTARTQIFDVWHKKLAEGAFINKQKEGVWKIYKNNRLVADETYQNGQKNGISHRYYTSGEMMEEKQWRHNKEEGNYQCFFKNGKSYMQCKMQKGQRNGIFIASYPDGTQQLLASYKDNLRHGEWKYFNKKGEYHYSLLYDKGKLQNPQVRDSIANLEMQNMQQNKEAIVDPEKFMQDPSGYMEKTRKY